MRTPKENKQILRDRTPKSTAGTIPKAVLKAAWLKTKEQSRTTARENDTDPRQQEPADLAGSAAEQAAAFVRHLGQKLAETKARQHRQKEAAARAHAANEPETSRVRHAARCGAPPAPWGRFAPTAGKRKSHHRQNRAARYSRCDQKSALDAHRRK